MLGLPPGDLFISNIFWVGTYSRGVCKIIWFVKLFDLYHIKTSLSRLLFYIILKEQSISKHQSISKSSLSSVVGTYSRGTFSSGGNSRINGIDVLQSFALI